MCQLITIVSLLTIILNLAKCGITQLTECQEICLECINPDQISVFQKGKCYKECSNELFLSLTQPCYYFQNDALKISNINVNKTNQIDFFRKPLVFNNIARVQIYNLSISDVHFANTNINLIPFFIGIQNIYNIIIKGINIKNCVNLPTIMRVQKVHEIVQFQDVNVRNTIFKGIQNIFQIIDGKQLIIYISSASNCSLAISNDDITQEDTFYAKLEDSNTLIDKWQPPIHASLFQSNGFQQVNLLKTLFYQNNRVSLIECYDYFFSNEQQSLFTRNQTNTVIQNIQAYNNYNANIYIGNSKRLIILKSEFINNTCVRCQGTSIYASDAIKLQISQSVFMNNIGLDGGSVYLKKCRCPSTPPDCISISTSQFTKNKAVASGGALLLDESDIHFEEQKIGSIFNQNYALVGGAIRYIKYLPYFFQKYSEANLFNINYNNNQKQLVVFDNHAQLWGQNIGSYPRDFKIDYQNPEEVIYNQDNSKNMLQKVEESSIIRFFQINDIRSGQLIFMRVLFLDEEYFPIMIMVNQTYPLSIRLEVQQFSITVQRSDNLTEIDGDYHMNYDEIEDGIFKFDNLRIYTRPSTSCNITISTNMIKIPSSDYTYQIYKIFYMKVHINFRLCNKGEIYSKYNNGTILWCEPCDFGKYSLDIPNENNTKQICKLCPENTVGCMEDLIILKNGYWRSDDNSDIVSECYNSQDNCIAQNKKNKYLCKEGHIGPLCESCDIIGEVWEQKYIQNTNYQCQTCREKGPTEILWAVIQLILIFGYHFMAMQTTHNMNYKILVSDYLRQIQMLSISKSAIQDETPFYLKCLTNYILIYSAINKVTINLLETAIETPKIFAYPIDNLKNIFDCYIASFLEDYKFPLEFAKMIWQLFSKKQNVSQQSTIFNGFIYFQIFFLPTNIKNIISGLFCRQIGNKNYVKSEMTYKCYSDDHIKFLCLIIITLLSQCFFSLLYIILYLKPINRDSPSTRLSFGFLFVGYKKDYYWWELIRIILRVIIIVIVSTQTYEGNTFINMAIFIIVLLTVYFICMITCQPHDRDKFNSLEVISSGILISILIINISVKNSASDVYESIGKIIIAIIHINFLIYLIFVILLAKMQAMYCTQYNGFKGYLKRKWPKLFSNLQFETTNQMRVYKNWKKLQEIYVQYKIRIDQKSKLIRRHSNLFGNDVYIMRNTLRVKPI